MFAFVSGLLIAILIISNIFLFAMIGASSRAIYDKLSDKIENKFNDLENRVKSLEIHKD